MLEEWETNKYGKILHYYIQTRLRSDDEHNHVNSIICGDCEKHIEEYDEMIPSQSIT